MASETVELIFKIRADGQATLDAVKRAVEGNASAVKGASAATTGLDKATANLNITLKQSAAAAGEAANAHKRNSDGMAMAALKGIMYADAIHKVIGAVKAATVESAQYAARTEQISVVMDQLARVNGLNVASVRAQANAVRDLGISTQESREVISKMIFAQIDLNKATELGRLAQNAAKIAGISSSEALTRIIQGTVSMQVEMLRNIGIQVNFEQALRRGAAALGKNSETLTENQRMNIMLQEVLSKGPRILGTYEVSLQTTAGQMQSLKRFVDEAKNSIGEQFAPALYKTVRFLTDATKHIREHADTWGELAKAITAVSAGLTVGALAPGGPLAKLLLGTGVAVGAYALSQEDAQAVAVEQASDAITKIQTAKKELALKSQTLSKENYLAEKKRLDEQELLAEEILTDKLAVIYKNRLKKLAQATPEGSVGFGGLKNAFGSQAPKITPDSVKLPNGRVITPGQILVAADAKPSTTVDPSGLQFKQDPDAELASQLAGFNSKIRDAMKAAQAGVARAKASMADGVERVEIERQAALAKVAEEFKPFDARLKAGGEYGRVLKLINQEFDILLAKERSESQIGDIKRAGALSIARGNNATAARAARTLAAQRVAAANVEPGNEQQIINDGFNGRVSTAFGEFESAQRKADIELDTARKIFAVNKDRAALQDAESKYRIDQLENELNLNKAMWDAEADHNIEMAKLRKKMRDDEAAAAANRQRIVDAERDVAVDAKRAEADRRIRLLQATATPGDERYVQEVVLAQRIKTAKEEHAMAVQRAAADRAAAEEQFKIHKDREKREKTLTDIRISELKSAAQLEKEIADARMDREIQIAEIRRRQSEELRQSLGSLYDAMKSGGRTGLRDFFNGYIEQIKKTIFVNVGELLLGGASRKLGDLIGGQEEIDPATGKGTGRLTTLGKILRGTPLGVDPAKLAQDREINSRDTNTKAVDRLTDALERTRDSVAGAAGYPGAGQNGGLGTIFGGSAGGMIFNGFPGGGGATGMGGMGGGLSIRNPDGSLNPMGSIAAAGMGALGVYAGIRQGGVRGGLNAASSAMMTAAAFSPEPVSKAVLMAGAMITQVVGGLLPDPRKQREELVARTLQERQYREPTMITREEDLAGNIIDNDYRGNNRVVSVNINTIDAKSFYERGPEFASVINDMVSLGHPLRETISEVR